MLYYVFWGVFSFLSLYKHPRHPDSLSFFNLFSECWLLGSLQPSFAPLAQKTLVTPPLTIRSQPTGTPATRRPSSSSFVRTCPVSRQRSPQLRNPDSNARRRRAANTRRRQRSTRRSRPPQLRRSHRRRRSRQNRPQRPRCLLWPRSLDGAEQKTLFPLR